MIDTQPDKRLVAEASSGREAIEQFRAHWPDITLMDLQMRGLSGLDAMLAISNEFPQAKIILLTTFAGDIEGARRLGARTYLLKAELDRELPGDHTHRLFREINDSRSSLRRARRCGIGIELGLLAVKLTCNTRYARMWYW